MRAVRPLVLCSIGGLLYVLCELVFRGRSHWTMFVVGGLCFWLIGLINEVIPWNMPVWLQCIIGAVIITTVEFIAGCIINIWLGWQVWDYSGLPFNILGQVCLPLLCLGHSCQLFVLYWMITCGTDSSGRINRIIHGGAHDR